MAEFKLTARIESDVSKLNSDIKSLESAIGKIRVQARLDKDTALINKDIAAMQGSLRALRIKASLDPESISRIQEQVKSALGDAVTSGVTEVKPTTNTSKTKAFPANQQPTSSPSITTVYSQKKANLASQAQIKQAKSQIAAYKKSINKELSKLMQEDDFNPSSVDQMLPKLGNLESEANNVLDTLRGKNGVTTDAFSQITQSISALEERLVGVKTELNDVLSANAAGAASPSKIDSVRNKLEKGYKYLGGIADKQIVGDPPNKNEIEAYLREIESVRSKTSQIIGQLDGGQIKQSTFNTLNNDARDLLRTIGQLKEKGTDFSDSLASSDEIAKFKDETDKLIYQYNKLLKNNTAIKHTPLGQDIERHAQILHSQGVNSKIDLKAQKKTYDDFKAQVDMSDRKGSSMTDKVGAGIAKFAAYWASSTAILKTVDAIKNGLNTIRELDSAMVELKKVTDETALSYNNFYKEANSSAKNLGASTKDYINATADFARLGYDFKDAQMLAKSSTIYSNVGDDISDIGSASESIISTMKAFGVEATDTMSIVDRFNEVSNQFAISSGGIGEALKRSAASFANAGNTLDESIGLIVAANNVVQDPESVGTMWKTTSMRIRGAKTDLEEAGLDIEDMAVSTSQLRDTIKAITNIDGGGGFDILTDTGAFKSTYDIILGIGRVWEQLGKTDPMGQASLLELLAGKRNANALSATFSNLEDLERATNVSQTSEGSAMAEQEKYMDSIDAKLNALKETTTGFWQGFVDSNVVKFLIDAAAATLNLFSLFNAAPAKILAVTTAIAAIPGIFNAIKDSKAVSILGEGFKSLLSVGGLDKKIAVFMSSFIESGRGLSGIAAGFKSVLATIDPVTASLTALSFAAIAGIKYLAEYEDNISKKADEVRENYSNAQKSYEEYRDSMDSIETEYGKLRQGVDSEGKSTSLSSDQYDRYKTLVGEIVSLGGEAYVTHMKNGEAIALEADAVEKLNAQKERQYELDRKEYINQIPTIWKDFENKNGWGRSTVIDMFKAQLSGESLFDALGYQFSLSELDKAKQSLSSLVNSGTKISYGSAEYTNIANVLKSFNDGEFVNYFGHIKDIESNAPAILAKLTNQYDVISAKQEAATKALKEGAHALAESFGAKELNSSSQNFLSSLIDNLDYVNKEFSENELQVANYTETLKSDIGLQRLIEDFDVMKNGFEQNTVSVGDFQAAYKRLYDSLRRHGIDAALAGVENNTLGNLQKIFDTVSAKKYDVSAAFSNFKSSQITQIESYLGKISDLGELSSGTAQGIVVSELVNTLNSLDSASADEFFHILNSVDKTDASSLKKYNAEMQSFLDRLASVDGGKFANISKVLGGIFGNAKVELEDYQARYEDFLKTVKEGGTPASVSAMAEGVKVLQEGLQNGETSSTLFNKSLDLLFGDTRPQNLSQALSEIELLFGESETAVNDMYYVLRKYSDDGTLNLRKVRDELQLSDLAFNSLKDKLREDGTLYTNIEDLNRIGDGFGLGREQALSFEGQAQNLLHDWESGDMNLDDLNAGLDSIIKKYQLAREEAMVFKRNMLSKATGSYSIGYDDNGNTGNITAFTGIGGETADTIEKLVSDAQETLEQKLSDTSITGSARVDLILNTSDTMDDIRRQLEETGEYTDAEIEDIITKIESRTYPIRVRTAVEAEIENAGGSNWDDETKQQILDAYIDAFNPENNTVDVDKLWINIGGLGVVKNPDANLTRDQIWEALGMTGDELNLGKLTMDFNSNSSESGVGQVTQDVKTLVQTVLDAGDLHLNLDVNTNAEEQAAHVYNLNNNIALFPDGQTKTLTFKIKTVGQVPQINGSSGGSVPTPPPSDSPDGAGAFGGKITRRQNILVNDGVGNNSGVELIRKRDGSFGYVESGGMPGIVTLDPGDEIFSAADTREMTAASYVSLGQKSCAGGTSGNIPSDAGHKAPRETVFNSGGDRNRKSSKDAKELAETLAELAKREHLEKLKKAIEDVSLELENLNGQISDFETLISLSDEDDFSTRLSAYSSLFDLSSQKASKLYDEFERLRGIVPQNADEAQELSNRLEELGKDIVDNAKDIREYATSLDMVSVDAVKTQIDGIDSQIENASTLLQRNIDQLTGHSMLGKSGVFSTAFLLPSMPESAIDKKRQENEKILELEQYLQEEIYHVKKKYSDMAFQETMEEIQKEREEAKEKNSSSSSGGSSSSSTTSSQSTEQAAPASNPSLYQTGSFQLTDATDYDALVSSIKNTLAARISQMVADFTSNDWQRIIQAHPLTSFKLDDASWDQLQQEIQNHLDEIQTDDTVIRTPSDIPSANVVQDALNTLVADTVNTEDSSWSNLTEDVRAYITETYGLTQEDWNALCASSPLIAASLKLTGDNSWDARNQQLNGSGGILPTMMANSQGVVSTTVLQAPQYNQAGYQNLGLQMGKTIETAIQSVIMNMKIDIPGVSFNGQPMTFGGGSGEAGISGTSTSIAAAASSEVLSNGGSLPKNNKYTHGIAEEWCGDFVDYCASSAGVKAPSQRSVINGASSMAGLGLYRSSTSGYIPQQGDFVYFDWQGAGGSAPLNALDHVGVVMGYDAASGAVHTIEGNTTGSKLARHTRKLSSNIIAGYGVTSALPRYERGTDGAAGGAALVGEKGRELAIYPNGQSVILGKNGAEIVDIPPMTQILPHDDTEDVLRYTGTKVDGAPIQKYASGTDLGQFNIGGSAGSLTGNANFQKYWPLFQEMGQKYGIDPWLLAAIAMQESGMDASSTNGYAVGLMQIENTLTDELAAMGYTLDDRWDTRKNVDFGASRVSKLMEHYGGDIAKVLQAYNFSEYSLDPLIDKTGGDWLNQRKNAGQYNGTGLSSYGDPEYIEHVLRYYAGGSLDKALSENTQAVTENTQAAESQEKTVSQKLLDITKTPTSYSQEFLDEYMAYAKQRESLLAAAESYGTRGNLNYPAIQSLSHNNAEQLRQDNEWLTDLVRQEFGSDYREWLTAFGDATDNFRNLTGYLDTLDPDMTFEDGGTQKTVQELKDAIVTLNNGLAANKQSYMSVDFAGAMDAAHIAADTARWNFKDTLSLFSQAGEQYGFDAADPEKWLTASGMTTEHYRNLLDYIATLNPDSRVGDTDQSIGNLLGDIKKYVAILSTNKQLYFDAETGAATDQSQLRVVSKAIKDAQTIKDIEQTFAMQLDLYTESAKVYQEQYKQLESLYNDAVAKGSDTSVLSEIIEAMNDVSKKIDDVSSKWQDAIDKMGESFKAVIDQATAKFSESITRSNRNLTNLEHQLNMTSDFAEKNLIYSSIAEERAKVAADTQSIMDTISATAEYQRGERSDNPAANNLALKQFAASNGQAVRQKYENVTAKFSSDQYEQWFNPDGTINTSAIESALADVDETLKADALSFASELSAQKVLYSAGESQQFADIIAQNGGLDVVNSWFDGNGEITQAAYEMLDGITDLEYKNRLMAFLTYQSTLKKAYYQAQEEFNSAQEAHRQTLIDQGQLQLDQYNQLLDKALEMVEQNYQEEQKIYENAHNARMKQIDEEREAIEKSYNRQIELLQDLKSEEDYNEELGDLEQDANSIRAQINALQMQGGLDADTTRRELEQKLKEKESEIAKKQRDHEYQEKVDALQEDLKKQQEYYDDLRDTEDDHYEWQQELLEKRYTQEERYNQAVTALETQTFTQIKATGEETYTSIAQNGVGTAMKLTEAYADFATQTGEKFENLGDTFEQMLKRMEISIELSNFATSNGKATLAFTAEFGSTTKGDISGGSDVAADSPSGPAYDVDSWGTGNNGVVNGNSASHELYLQTISNRSDAKTQAVRGREFERIKAVIANRLNSSDPDISEQLSYLKELLKAAESYGISGHDTNELRALLNQHGVNSYHTGRNKEELAVVLDDETILTKLDVKHINTSFAKLMGIVDGISNFARNVADQFSFVSQTPQTTTSTSYGNTYNFEFTKVEKNDIPYIKEAVTNVIKDVDGNGAR